VTPLSHPEPPALADGLFMPADHVVVVRQGSAIAILDLERAVVYATTPFGAEAWASLVGGAGAHRAKGEAGQVSAEDEASDAWARVAGYLLDCRIMEPVTRPAGNR
jgi:hypothetical protein